jgi:hypothetical protein
MAPWGPAMRSETMYINSFGGYLNASGLCSQTLQSTTLSRGRDALQRHRVGAIGDPCQGKPQGSGARPYSGAVRRRQDRVTFADRARRADRDRQDEGNGALFKVRKALRVTKPRTGSVATPSTNFLKRPPTCRGR